MEGGPKAPRARRGSPAHCPQHFLYFFPLPQGHGSLRPTFSGARYGSTGPPSPKSPPAASAANSSARRGEASFPKGAHHDVALPTSSIGGHRSFMRSTTVSRGDAAMSSSSQPPTGFR